MQKSEHMFKLHGAIRLRQPARRLATAFLALALILLQLVSAVPVRASTEGWLAPGDPEIKFSELSPNYVPPQSYNFNTDCHTRNFDVVTREAKPIPVWPFSQTELRHKSNCAVQSRYGMHDGFYLSAGVPAGKLYVQGGYLELIPNSSTLMSFFTVVNGMTIQASFHDAISPSFNETTGEIQYNLVGHEFLADKAGNKIYLRPGSQGYSSDGAWMVSDSSVGFIRVDLQNRRVLPFAAGLSYGQGEPLPRVAISPDGRYSAIASRNSLFKIYDLATCASVPDSISGPVACQSKDVRPFLSDRFRTYRQSYYIRFASPELLTFVTSYTDQTGSIKQVSVRLAPSGHVIEDVTYLALGDSFSSGEGAYDYESGTDNSNPNNKCHLSTNSYPYLAAEALNLSGFHSVACSGATTEDYFMRQDKREEVPGSPLGFWLPGYQGQNLYIERAEPSVVTISMIGNDIGFDNKLKRCLIITDSCFHFREDRQSIAREIHGKFDTLVDLYNKIQEDSPGVKVYVLGYPQLVSATGECGLNTPLDAEERQMARGLVTYLNAVIKAATEKAGVKYIDVEGAFAGHQLCEEGQKAVNGLTAGDDKIGGIGPLGNESFHPNAFGHELLSSALLQQSESLTKQMPGENSTKKPPFEGSAPYNTFIGSAPSGGALTRATYTSLNGLKMIIAGSPFSITPTEVPLKPNGVFEVWMHSEPVQIGTITSNEGGELSGELAIPENMEPGYHTLHIYGQNLAGQEIDLYKTIYVAASETDIDGDGVLNEDEACLGVEPAGVDEDRDRIDDACDPEITEPPSDIVPPEVIGIPDREPNADGWYDDDVRIRWSVTDPEPSSGEPSKPPDTVASQEGVHLYTSEESCDPAGNCTTGSLELKIDKTSPQLGVANWNNNPKPIFSGTTFAVPATESLSGMAEAEYFFGDTDPGLGSGAAIEIDDGALEVNFGTDFPTGVYKITIRAKDKAGNWSQPVSDYLVVYDPLGTQMTGKKTVLPSLANGDALPGLINADQLDKAKFGFNIRYDKDGKIHKNSDFQFEYKTGTRCNNPDKASNCHSFELNALSISWLTTQGQNDSTGIFQGTGKLDIDGTSGNVIFRLTGLDGELLNPTSQDHLTLKVYPENVNPNAVSPLYQVSAEVFRGNIKIRRW